MKKLFLITTILLLTAPAIAAEDPPAQPAQMPGVPAGTGTAEPTIAPAPAVSKFYLEVDQSDLQALSAAISELPKKIADPLLLKLNGQLNPQVQATLKAQQEATAKSGEKVPLPKPRPGKRD